ncbi:MAG: hypothetical protein ACD_8C00107G0006 [uncultured bacterium]|nr:MAG: hypothetical protein ACD_8C00107G0006 [uncultured bacterium]
MDIILSSINGVVSDLKIVGDVLSYTWYIILPPLFFLFFKLLWMYHIQGAFWDSADWVLLELIPPKNIEKSPKPMEALFAGFAGVEKSFNTFEIYKDGAFTDYMSLEIVSDQGTVHFYIRTMIKYRHIVEAHLYAQYPDVEILEVSDYVDDVPKIIPNKQWDLWGTDFMYVRPKAYPIRTYKTFEEDITGTMIDPLSSVLEVMGKLGPGMRIWFQIIIKPASPSWASKEGVKITDKLKGKEKKESGMLERFFSDLADVFLNIIPAMKGPVEFASEKKKEESPLDTRLSPGERDVLKAVEDNLGKLQFYTKMRFVLVGRREVMDKSFVSSFTGGLKQFGDDNLNSFKPDNISKTKADYWMRKSRLAYKQRKILRRYRNRSMDGVPDAEMVMSSEELATVFHLPDMNVMAPSLTRVEAKRGGAPSNLPIE